MLRKIEIGGGCFFIEILWGRWGGLGEGVFDQPSPVVYPYFIDVLSVWGRVGRVFSPKKELLVFDSS